MGVMAAMMAALNSGGACTEPQMWFGDTEARRFIDALGRRRYGRHQIGPHEPGSVRLRLNWNFLLP
jgi:hypothetical protein